WSRGHPESSNQICGPEVKYDSEKHFINNIYMPMGLGMSSCSQTVVCVPSSTWRNYKAEVRFRPRNKAQSFTSTTIIYPKHTKTVYTTTLDYNGRKSTQSLHLSLVCRDANPLRRKALPLSSLNFLV
uniref:Refilin B n=1 Tax=Varanus komodoensis TaxID=61221 RepID=A0A8D2L2Z7_VARKO